MPFGTGARLHRTLSDVDTPHTPPDIARLSMAEMPDGPSGRVLTGRGIGVEPAYAPAPGAEIVRKTVNETVSNDTTPQNDDELFLPIGAGERWQITFYVRGVSTTTANWRMRVIAPSGAEGDVFLLTRLVDISAPLGTGLGFDAFGSRELIIIHTIVINGTVSGNVQLQWMQGIAEASNTTVFANSLLIAHKIR